MNFFTAKRARSSTGNQSSDQRLGFLETADTGHSESDDAAILVHSLHDGVMLGFLLVTSGIGETDLQEIRFRLEPDSYFVGYKSSPAFGLSVK